MTTFQHFPSSVFLLIKTLAVLRTTYGTQYGTLSAIFWIWESHSAGSTRCCAPAFTGLTVIATDLLITLTFPKKRIRDTPQQTRLFVADWVSAKILSICGTFSQLASCEGLKNCMRPFPEGLKQN